MKYLALLFLLIIAQFSLAQKEANIWYFGANAGLDFNNGKVVPLTNGQLNNVEGCAVMSASNGRLLFYTDGKTIWDSTHSIMQNGTGLLGFLSSTQSSLIVQGIDSLHLFYIFTTDYAYGKGLNYSVVNMNLNSGKGAVDSNYKNVNLIGPITEKITATVNSNHDGYWVVSHLYNSDTICAFQVSAKGVNKVPIKSGTGFRLGDQPKNAVGYLKISPDGKKIASANTGKDTSFIADFNNASGKVSNVWLFKNFQGYGVEFSPKSKYLYIDELQQKTLYQYDLQAKTNAAFIASKKTIDSGEVSMKAIQMGSDHKIYIAQDTSRYLGVILWPDSSGSYCAYKKNYLFLNGKSSLMGLPNFVQSIFLKTTIEIKHDCINDTTYFLALFNIKPDSMRWDFGDPKSGILNTTNKKNNVSHYYKNSGRFLVQLICYHRTKNDTVWNFLTKYPKINLGRDTIFCNDFSIILGPKTNYVSYKWNTGHNIQTINVFKGGIYSLSANDSNKCNSTDTITLKSANVKANFRINDSSQCLKNNRFEFEETSQFIGASRKQSIWLLEDGSSLNDSVKVLYFSKPVVQKIKLISKSQVGCLDSITKQITVNPNANAAFEINDSVQCFNEHRFDFDIKEDTGKVSFVWDLGDKSITIGNDITDKKYLDDGTYNIRLIATTDKNCSDTVDKSVTVLPSPKADFSWGIACSRTPAKFEYTGSKPVQSFLWNFNNEATSTLENPTHKFASSGTSITTLTLTSPNGCTDAVTKTIDIKTQSKADFITTDVCETDSAVFTNKSADATSYNWRFGDGLKSTKESPKHLYNIGGISKTFNVSLVAIVNNGCSDSITKAISINANPKSDFSYSKSGKSFNFTSSQSGNSKYRWLFGDGDSAITGTASHTYTDALNEHTVCLKTTNAAGCISETCKILSTAGVSLITPSGFKVYPNPNTGSFSIEMDNPTREALIEVYDLMGKRVKTIERVEKITLVDLELTQGIYLVKVTNGANLWLQKVFVSGGEDTRR